MSNITVYNVIELGVNNLLSDYDNWTLHWQYGHVLTIFEQALSLGNQHVVDVEKYNKLFGYGSNPRDWKGQDVPAINEIKQHIQTLPERAKKLTHEQLAQKLDQPIAGCNTLDELLMLNAIHVPKISIIYLSVWIIISRRF
ncbi:MAG: DinB family protein [Staphylococcus epidermidis]|nr:DinB family protein [Staphylococcus epidermidis]